MLRRPDSFQCLLAGLTHLQKAREKISLSVRVIAEHSYYLSLTPTCKALEVLQEIFPEFQPPDTETETCAVCEALAASDREASKEARTKAEAERVSSWLDAQTNSDTSMNRVGWPLYPDESSLGR